MSVSGHNVAATRLLVIRAFSIGITTAAWLIDRASRGWWWVVPGIGLLILGKWLGFY